MEISELLTRLQDRDAILMDQDNYRTYGIMLPLVRVASEIHVLFEIRSLTLRTQPGDVCFPGGKMDPDDKSPLDCAVRETKEELGIDGDHINEIIQLDYLISESGRIIYPFAGVLKGLNAICRNEAEVDEVFTVPLNHFIETPPKEYKVKFHAEPEENFPYELIHMGRDYNFGKREIKELFYLYEDKVIWGLTAKVLHHFVGLWKREYVLKD